MFNFIILAAGKGTRMKSSISKVLHKVAGLEMVNWVLDLAKSFKPKTLICVTSTENNDFINAQNKVIQTERLGTGHAVLTALNFIKPEGRTFILYGDTPLVTKETLERMSKSSASIVVLGFHSLPVKKYGRLIVKGDAVEKITEFKDATEEEKLITLCNSGIFLVDTKILLKLIPLIKNNNASKEFYLTDIIELANKEGIKAEFILCEEEEVLGVNSMAELFECEQIMQNRLRLQHMENGVFLKDKNTTYFNFDTKIANDVTIEPNVFFGSNVEVLEGVTIKAFSHLEGCIIKEGCSIGPFARIRPKTVIEKKSKIGNFVELKNANLQEGVKAGHLAYIGDAIIGNETNIGAGTIFCNYDGKNKHISTVESNVFIGSNSSIVSPVIIEEGSIIAAGSVITKKVSKNSLGIARSRQINIENYKRK